MIHPREDRGEPVVIRLRDGIELVIVATRAVDRQPQKRTARRGDDFVDRVRADQSGLGGILVADIVVRSGDKKGGADFNRRIVLPDHVARELFAHEAIEWLVVVERFDDVIAERPGVADDLVALKAAAFAEANDIEPVPAPLFAVARRIEQAIDQLLVGGRIGIVDELPDFLGAGRQTGEVVSGASNQCPPIGGGGRGEPVPLEFGEDVPVDRILHPRRGNVFGRRWPCLDERPERPPVERISLAANLGSIGRDDGDQHGEAKEHARLHGVIRWTPSTVAASDRVANHEGGNRAETI